MNRKNTSPIPEAIAQLQQQLDQFRSTQPPRTRLPESMWQAAVKLARQHGVYAVAHPLGLDFTRLQERLGGGSGRQPKSPKAAFVELITPRAATLEEFLIEFESASRGKLRIHWKAAGPPDWTNLLRAWREAEG